jgi:hypothetical protein
MDGGGGIFLKIPGHFLVKKMGAFRLMAGDGAGAAQGYFGPERSGNAALQFRRPAR